MTVILSINHSSTKVRNILDPSFHQDDIQNSLKSSVICENPRL